jgi:hypothetical protein
VVLPADISKQFEISKVSSELKMNQFSDLVAVEMAHSIQDASLQEYAYYAKMYSDEKIRVACESYTETRRSQKKVSVRPLSSQDLHSAVAESLEDVDQLLRSPSMNKSISSARETNLSLGEIANTRLSFASTLMQSQDCDPRLEDGKEREAPRLPARSTKSKGKPESGGIYKLLLQSMSSHTLEDDYSLSSNDAPVRQSKTVTPLASEISKKPVADSHQKDALNIKEYDRDMSLIPPQKKSDKQKRYPRSIRMNSFLSSSSDLFLHSLLDSKIFPDRVSPGKL